MPRRVAAKKPRRQHYLKQWRIYRGLTQAQLADRLETTEATISRIESGIQPYTQDVLEAWADALLTDAASLLMRNPLEEEAIWTVWERAKPAERKRIVRQALEIVKKTGTGAE